MDSYKKLLAYVPEKKHLAYVSLVLSMISAGLLVLPFWYLWKFLYELIMVGNAQRALHYAMVIVGLLLLNSLIYFLALWASHLLAFRLESNLRKKGTLHLMEASFAFFDVHLSGRIRKIIDDNAVLTHMIVAHLIPDITAAVMLPILMLVTMFAVDWQLGILMLVGTIVGIIQMKLMMGGQSFMDTYAKALERMNAEAVEYIRGMQVVKIFRTTVISFKTFYAAIMDYSNHALNYSMSCRVPYVIFQVMFHILMIVTIPFAIVYMNRGLDTAQIVTKLIFFAGFSGIMFTAFMRIMYVGMYQYQAMQAVKKLEDLFEEMEKGKLEHGKVERFESYDIEFRKVTFKYDRENILEDLSFMLEQNKTYALVGSSGGGKSTIAKLISGFYSVESGSILIGGTDIRAYSEEALMNNIAFVFQHAKLFKTTIFENVKIGNPKATDEQVMQALKQARCNDILDKFEEREHTMIGAKGVHLSGGEIQRIAIARAILKDARIIILDEASAAADPENEYEIQQAFSNLMKNKTVIMIAHRLSSIRNVDEILVIDGGKIVERGTDESLMQLGGRYRLLQDMFSKANDWRIYEQLD